MTQILLPADADYVDTIARAIARERYGRDAIGALEHMLGQKVSDIPENILEESINRVFDSLWNGDTDNDKKQRENYRAEARAVISALNLKLLTSEG